ncbi:MAG: hypothetical protein ACOC6F_02825 [bacterium]
MSLPEQIESAMRDAIDYLAEALTRETVETSTHRAMIVVGWNRDEATRRAIARYLVGLRACAMDAALNIKADLEDTEADRIEVLGNVIAVVGEDNSEDTEEKKEWKIRERNPWIAEGLWHLCLAVARHRQSDLHPPGAILALNYAHVITSDPGLDVAAIYRVEDLIGLSLVESKAHKNDVNKGMSEAVAYFREINEGKKHALRIRQTVQSMRASLPPDVNSLISASFWKRARAYLPNPHYDASLGVDWTNSRPSLPTLMADGVDIQVIVMPHPVQEYDEFFDRIAEEMRIFARSLVDV